MNTIQRLMRRILVDPATDCWIWKGRFVNGVPIATVEGRCISVRRFFHERDKGKLPDGQRVTYTCEDARCVIGAHSKALTIRAMLIEGARRGLRYDARWKARQIIARRNSKDVVVSMEIARQIRQRLTEIDNKRQVAREFNVSDSTVGKIARNQAWREAPASSLAMLCDQQMRAAA